MSSHCTFYVDLGDNPDAPRLQPGRNWDLLNLLLAGSREPTDHTRGFLVSDFVELAAEAHQIPAEDVASIAAAIVNRSTDDAVACFDTVQLSDAGPYDADLAAQDPEGYSRELREQIEDLRRFLTHAAAGGHGVIRVIA